MGSTWCHRASGTAVRTDFFPIFIFLNHVGESDYLGAAVSHLPSLWARGAWSPSPAQDTTGWKARCPGEEMGTTHLMSTGHIQHSPSSVCPKQNSIKEGE